MRFLNELRTHNIQANTFPSYIYNGSVILSSGIISFTIAGNIVEDGEIFIGKYTVGETTYKIPMINTNTKANPRIRALTHNDSIEPTLYNEITLVYDNLKSVITSVGNISYTKGMVRDDE